MKHIRNFLILSLLLAMMGCDTISGSHGTGISTEDWCDKDKNSPWSGCWREIKQIDCETGSEFEAEEEIGELRMKADGTYSITWHPFEHYTDFIGSYEVDETGGKITFSSNGKPGFDGDGFFLIREDGTLELREIWFGMFYDDTEVETLDIPCGYVFEGK